MNELLEIVKMIITYILVMWAVIAVIVIGVFLPIWLVSTLVFGL